MADKCERCERPLKNKTYRYCIGCKHGVFAAMERDGYLPPPLTGDAAQQQAMGAIAKEARMALGRK